VLIVHYTVWKVVGSHNSCDCSGTSFCFAILHFWLCLLLLPTLWQVWWRFKTRTSREQRLEVLHPLYHACPLCLSVVVSFHMWGVHCGIVILVLFALHVLDMIAFGKKIYLSAFLALVLYLLLFPMRKLMIPFRILITLST